MNKQLIPQWSFIFKVDKNNNLQDCSTLNKSKFKQAKTKVINVFTNEQIYDLIYNSLWDSDDYMLLDNDVDKAALIAYDLLNEGEFSNYYALNNDYWIDDGEILDKQTNKTKILHVLNKVSFHKTFKKRRNNGR